jgi:hypothetical protein
LDPDDQDRVTAVPLRQPWAVRTASAISVARPVEPKQFVNPWRAARP